MKILFTEINNISIKRLIFQNNMEKYGCLNESLKTKRCKKIKKSLNNLKYDISNFERINLYETDHHTVKSFIDYRIKSNKEYVKKIINRINELENKKLNSNLNLKDLEEVEKEISFYESQKAYLEEETEDVLKNGLNDYEKWEIENGQIARLYHERQRLMLKKYISSNIYKRRLKRELKKSGDKGNFAKFHQNVRINNLSHLDYSMNDPAFIPDDEHNKYLMNLPYLKGGDGFEWKKNNPYTATHEFAHGMTDGIKGISEYAKKIYTDSFIIPENYRDYPTETGNKDFFESYYNNPSERDARKRVMSQELEDLGIKKNKERFRKKHYMKIMELFNNYNNSKKIKKPPFSKNTMEFINMTKKDFKIWKIIFNKIA